MYFPYFLLSVPIFFFSFPSSVLFLCFDSLKPNHDPENRGRLRKPHSKTAGRIIVEADELPYFIGVVVMWKVDHCLGTGAMK